MPILAGDIKLVASQVMQDVVEGGGAPTSNVITDGASNAIFDDISELDRAGGRVSMRKTHVTVQTPTTDGFFGANVIIAEPPEDPRVSVTLFSTNATFDRRTDAQTRVEAYLAPGAQWGGYLLENHVAGQRAIAIFQRPGTTLPNVGQTLLLISGEGTVLQKAQYVRVTKVTPEERTFTHSSSGSFVDYQAMVVTCDLSDPLRYDFRGSVPARTFERDRSTEATNPTAVIKDTVVADAGNYYGVVALADDVAIGALSARVESVYTQLVPSARAEIPVVDARPGMISPNVAATSTQQITVTTSGDLDTGGTLARYFGHPVARYSVTLQYAGQTLTDDGRGAFAVVGGLSGTVNYETGEVELTNIGSNVSGDLTMTALPAAVVQGETYTASNPVTIEARAYNWVRTLKPNPAPGTVNVDYQVFGKWYRLSDNGVGVLSGGAGVGTGTVNYATGTVSVTLGALPDADSRVLWSWGSSDVGMPATFTAHVNPPTIILDADILGLQPGTVTVKYKVAGATKTLTDSDGVLSGDGTGYVLYTSGLIGVRPSLLPDAAAGQDNFSVTYQAGGVLTETIAGEPDALGVCEYTLEEAPIRPRSLLITFSVGSQRSGQDADFVVRDDGNGVLHRLRNDSTWQECGGIDYTTGEVTLSTKLEYFVMRLRTGSDSTTSSRSNSGTTGTSPGTASETKYEYVWSDGMWSRQPYTAQTYVDQTTTQQQSQNQVGNTSQSAWSEVPDVLMLSSAITNKYRVADDEIGASTTVLVAPPSLQITLKSDAKTQIVPGSVRFTIGSRVYVDRDGVLYYDVSPVTNAGAIGGAVNYATGTATVSSWPSGASPTLTGVMALVRGAFRPDKVVFRAPASNIIPGSVQVRALAADTNELLMLTAGNDGYFGGAAAGRVEYATGIIELAFGEMVTAEDVPEDEREDWWYDEDLICTNGDIWRPRRVIADSVRFNCVASSYIPLDANILGLDPVRLPQDGRVPIFRVGGFAVLGHAGVSGPHTVSNAQVIDLGRERLSRVRVIDSGGATIETGYSVDLDAGEVTFTNVSGYSQPITIEHRIEDMAVVSDVQINGDLTFTRQITHAYPLGSYVSSALIAGDLRARVSILFDQQTWDNTWNDAVKGSAALATFNDAQHPIVVSNAGAVTERWLIQFTNTTNFNVIGEHLGVIAIGNTGTTCAPTNLATDEPYFSIPSAGWGLGWASGNVLRFNTIGAQFPVWVVRTIQQGPETLDDDSFTLLVRGDVDKP